MSQEEAMCSALLFIAVSPQDPANKLENENSLLVWLAVIVFIILAIGCLCGRASKKAYRELKNR
ncbi:hypothetical protein NECAME_09639 [Necator americanus]|uniref:Uncharacterized protein n=1 Tax=Necator americanus TaxID=51031 RepID=W2TFJ9_NECAM|nr:hypothetical protein NECAME_09639 [Necator americanus]ETN79772.1 hypothetical protein NECAME_09639 [Necator americanus]